MSRPTFYKVQSDFTRSGLVGLLPAKRGPRGPRKITPDVLRFIEEAARQRGEVGYPGPRCAHCPTLWPGGALAHRGAGLGTFEKKSAMNPTAASLDGHALVARYEALRQDVVGSSTCHHAVRGLALFMRNGMAAWMKSVGGRAAAPRCDPDDFIRCRECLRACERSLIDIVATMALATALEGRRDF